MTEESDLLHSYFSKLGLDPEAADIYVALQTYGPQSISELSRNAGVARIQIYRLLDKLKASGIVEVEIRYKRSVIHAAPISSIQVLIAQREQELKDLRLGYEKLATSISDKSLRSTTTRVQFYEGMDGLKQMLWNQTKGKSENLAILYDNMQNKTNLAFFERWVQTCNERGVHFRGIIGDHFIKTQQEWYARHSNKRLEHWRAGYISEQTFPISQSIITYDDVVLHYDWSQERIFGIEINNVGVARMQRQFFDMLWRQATIVDDLVGLRGDQTQ